MILNQSRLAVLQRRRVRQARLLALIATWAANGVAVSTLSSCNHEELVKRFRAISSDRSRLYGSLHDILIGFSASSDMIVVIGWDVDEQPGLLLNGDRLVQSETFLRAAYVNGFVVANQPFTRALIVDFHEADIEVDEVRSTSVYL